jgi:hypothetical protein
VAAPACWTAASQIDECPESFSSKCGMDRMNNGANYDSIFWNVLIKEHLADLSQFHGRGFFDEVPLFSRDSDVSFLKELTIERANGTLIGFALKFLKSVVSYEEHRSPYFAAVTIWSGSQTELVVPNLFVWSGSIARLRKRLILDVVRTPFGKKIKRIVSGRNLRSGFDLLEDTSTDAGETRVFISFTNPPYKSFEPLSRFRTTEVRAK